MRNESSADIEFRRSTFVNAGYQHQDEHWLSRTYPQDRAHLFAQWTAWRPLSFDLKDQALEYQGALVFDISLTHRDTGQVLWQATNLRVTTDYSAVPQVVVTTSPEFLQGTLNPEDLPGLTTEETE